MNTVGGFPLGAVVLGCWCLARDLYPAERNLTLPHLLSMMSFLGVRNTRITANLTTGTRLHVDSTFDGREELP